MLNMMQTTGNVIHETRLANLALAREARGKFYRVQPGIPMPLKQEAKPGAMKKKARSKYPFATMKVGDSFAVPLGTAYDKNGTPKTKARLSSACFSYGKKHGTRYRAYALYERHEVRVWRVA